MCRDSIPSSHSLAHVQEEQEEQEEGGAFDIGTLIVFPAASIAWHAVIDSQ
ncbi:MAG: hypothetical protein OJF51_003174 [Nitrospira sp.]|jgi:hypothetical protein|nr:MAG: hypothetical protein OJF51_003174 [Nitrospira sp.]